MKLLPFMLAAMVSVKNIPFTRVNMPRDEMGRRVEGYWATSSHPLKDSYKGKYPFPQANAAPWNGKETFIKKLHAIETYALINQGMFKIISYRGLSTSRLTGEHVGHKEFHDVCANVAWPDGLRNHYFEKFNVLPSREFYEYVMNSTVIPDRM